MNSNSKEPTLFDNISTNNLPISHLIKQSNKYKLTVSSTLEHQIRYLCSQFPNTEWSGILFYNHQGSIIDNTLQLNCIDMYLMDIGTAGETDFDMSSEVITYMADNNLIDCQFGLIHSHHSMSTFFSATDLNTLRIEGSERNHFLSLIVNNTGKYSAALTQKVVNTRNVEETTLYSSFNNEEYIKQQEKRTELVNEVYYYELDITIDSINTIDSISSRIQEIKIAKANKNNTYINTFESPKIQTVNIPSIKVNKLEDFDVDSKLVDNIVLQLVSGYILASNKNNLDIKKLVSSMPKLYGKKFKDIQIFISWAETYIPYVLDLETFNYTMKESASIVEEVIEKLREFANTNIYIDEIIDQCEAYMLNFD